ncbi:MAG: hypothetical protein FWD53_03525 [Phycisphaerales bacterium]|nr:hypothetical protein [Phycisphaerales bacterium]
MTNQSYPENKSNEGIGVGGYMALVLAWLVPGLGHLVLGEKARGLIFAATIHGLFAAGMLIAGVRAINPPEQQIWTYTQYLAGWPMLVASPVERRYMAESALLIKRLQEQGRLEMPDGQVLMRPPVDDDSQIPDRIRFGKAAIKLYPLLANHPKIQDIGAVYCGIAGMLNLLVMFDVLLRITGSTREKPEQKPEASPPPSQKPEGGDAK